MSYVSLQPEGSVPFTLDPILSHFHSTHITKTFPLTFRFNLLIFLSVIQLATLYSVMHFLTGTQKNVRLYILVLQAILKILEP